VTYVVLRRAAETTSLHVFSVPHIVESLVLSQSCTKTIQSFSTLSPFFFAISTC
jgi:hypothetical protein